MPELTWLGERKARLAARQVPYRLLEAVSEVGDAAADNLLIQGDNLAALKSLLPLYAGRVKCVFIDPPYNTRSAFEHYDDNLEHSQWLSMMYPRLVLLRDLLAEDGSIWVTIDDNEAHYLKVIMDEVFERSNFVADIAWQKVFAKKNKALISGSHDHLLVAAKNIQKWKRNLLPRSGAAARAFKNPDNDPRGNWQSVSYSVQSEDSDRRQAYRYAIRLPSGREVMPPQGRHWNGLEDRTALLSADRRLWFGKDGDSPPRLKVFLSEVQDGIVPDTWWSHDDAGSNQDAKKEILALFPDTEPFGTPKPEALLNRVLEVATNPGDLVLDSFLGSGTTAAVAHKMGRRWIGIEMGEHAATHCLPRLTKVVEGEQGGISQAVGWQGGGGFRFMRLGDPVFLDDGRIAPSVRFAPLAAYLWFLETHVPWAGTSHHGPSPRPSPRRGEGEKPTSAGEGEKLSPLLGIHGDTAIVLLYNGILGDKRPQGGNVLTHAVWDEVRALAPDHAGPWLVYGEASRLQPATLKKHGIVFRQIPYDIGAR
ncbi:MAG: site-specific DNA-methyltransferase [Rhodanobacteraceae bacterium]|jgi:adenine-specific DNA-methyltransferase|nr:site-specific DNA-methyltransferase [Rhodanobacteraceae bacterium]